MIQELFQLYADRWQFFLKLTLQHLEISLIAIVAALCIGLSLGILISSYRRSSSLVLGLTNFMYTIPSIALFGFLIPFSGIGDTTAIFPDFVNVSPKNHLQIMGRYVDVVS